MSDRKYSPEEQKHIDAWANMMLNEAIDDMVWKDIPVTPQNFSKFFQENYELPRSPQEAEDWLKEQAWYQQK